jgi:putative salt-induced outer membrane protein YdiY
VFKLNDIAAINPPAKPGPKWTGNISAGVTSTQGNTKTTAINSSINLQRRSDKDRTQVGLDYAKGRQEDPDTGTKITTEDWWRSKGKYDYFFSKKMYGYVGTRYETDKIALLDRRMLIGGGGGYQWIESDDMKLSTEAGLASLYEKFDNQPKSNSELTAQAGYNLEKRLAKNIKFLHDLTYYPSFENLSDYYLTSTGEFRLRFTERMFLNFKTIFSYDSTPAPGKGGTDVKYLLGVGLEF